MSIGFFFKEAFRSMRRSAIPSFAAMTCVLVTMLLLGVFIPAMQVTSGAADEVSSRVLVNVYMKSNATDVDVARVRVLLEQKTPNVKKVQFLTKEQVYAEQKKKNPQEFDILGKENPFTDEFRVTPESPGDVESIKSSLAPTAATGKAAIRDGSIGKIRDSRDDTKKIIEFTQALKIIAILFSGLLIIASVLLIANTVRLSLFARRREVEVMKLVGATDWFIRWPFIIEGIVLGGVGGVLAILLLGVAEVTIIEPLSSVIELIGALDTTNFAALIGILLLSSIAVSVIGSLISLRRFLKI